MTTANKLKEIKEQALTLIIEIQNNFDAYDDDLEETFSRMIKTMGQLQLKMNNFVNESK